MQQKLKNARSQALRFLIASNLGLAVVGALVWLLLDSLSLGSIVKLVAVIAVMSSLGLLLALYQEAVLTRPLKVLTEAYSHIGQQPSQQAAPNAQEAGYGRDLVLDFVTSVYNLASSQQAAAQKGAQTEILSDILQNIGAGVIALHKEGTVAFANSAAEALFKPTEGTLATAQFKDVAQLSFQSRATFDQWLEECRAQKITENQFWDRVMQTMPDGSTKLIDLAAHYSKDDPQNIELVLVAIDRTEEYQTDQEDLDFVSLAAHELRGPITVIRGYLDVLNREIKANSSAEHQKLLERMTVSSNQLSNYIHTILNVAKIDQGTLKIYPTKHTWASLFKLSSQDQLIRAQAMNRLIQISIADDLPAVAVDESAIGQVIHNLLDNAVKYSSDGGVVEVSATRQDNMIETTITDHGIGVPESVVGRLFNKFYRSHRSRQGVSGTGLGLFVSKAIVEAHGGTIWVRSKEGEGATFGFTVPVYDEQIHNQPGTAEQQSIERRSHGWIKNHNLVRK